jgi:hypothetical protein
MTKILELIDRFSTATYETDYRNAKARGTCIICEKSAKEFRNASAKLEYDVSGLCQNCQDEYFNKT